MAKIQCKMCGGMVELPEDVNVGECPYCGSVTTFPKTTSVRAEQLHARAEHYRHAADFDKAVSTYEAIIAENPSDAEAHWGLVLSRFGIEYVEDPATHERIPTCHRVQYSSILQDADYKYALEVADGYERDVYEREAQRIAEIQKGILAISRNEKPFDVFICYKETTEGGSRTKDSALAQDIYYQLANVGYNVFFSRITLEKKLGEEYEPYIFAALNSAKVMLVVGTRQEHFNAVWVKNEWSRFLALTKKDRSRLLIPCYRDMDPYDLPEELSMLQSQDMSKIGFIQDILHGIGKVLAQAREDAGKKQEREQATAVAQDPEALIKRITIFLKMKDFNSAKEYCNRVLDMQPENSDVYLYRLLAEWNCSEVSELRRLESDYEKTNSFKLAMEFGDDRRKAQLNELIRLQNEKRLAKKREILLDELEKLREEMMKVSHLGLLTIEEKMREMANETTMLPDVAQKAQAYADECLKRHHYLKGLMLFEANRFPEALRELHLAQDYSNAKDLLGKCKMEDLAAKNSRMNVVWVCVFLVLFLVAGMLVWLVLH